MKTLLVILIMALLIAAPSTLYAASKDYDSSDIIKGGLLGAGAGAVGGLASGAKGGDVWKGALAGAGVNIIGGALLDSLSGEKVGSVNQVDRMDSQQAFSEGYQQGFNNGYKQGYTQGFKDAREGS